VLVRESERPGLSRQPGAPLDWWLGPRAGPGPAPAPAPAPAAHRCTRGPGASATAARPSSAASCCPRCCTPTAPGSAAPGTCAAPQRCRRRLRRRQQPGQRGRDWLAHEAYTTPPTHATLAAHRAQQVRRRITNNRFYKVRTEALAEGGVQGLQLGAAQHQRLQVAAAAQVQRPQLQRLQLQQAHVAARAQRQPQHAHLRAAAHIVARGTAAPLLPLAQRHQHSHRSTAPGTALGGLAPKRSGATAGSPPGSASDPAALRTPPGPARSAAGTAAPPTPGAGTPSAAPPARASGGTPRAGSRRTAPGAGSAAAGSRPRAG
jgi:hypothetical protein